MPGKPSLKLLRVLRLGRLLLQARAAAARLVPALLLRPLLPRGCQGEPASFDGAAAALVALQVLLTR